MSEERDDRASTSSFAPVPLTGAETQPHIPAELRTASGAPPRPVIPGYEIHEQIGRGGMGVVWKARHLRLNRIVALKMVRHPEYAGEQELLRFLAEAEAVARLQHPNVVQLFDAGACNGLPYFTLEFMPGGSLADRLREQPLPPREAALVVQQVAHGVQHAHENGIIHRDLKPANILLAPASGGREPPDANTPDGGASAIRGLTPPLAEWIPKVTDFGLARRMKTEMGLTVTGMVVGTPSYVAPEQATGTTKTVSPLADVYALGAVLYECLTGRPPFRAATQMDTLLQVMHVEAVPVRALQPGVPRDLETICHKCLQKEPHKRYASAAELADDLGRFLRNEPVKARPVGYAERVAKWVKRRPTVAALTAGMVLLVLVGSVLVGWNWLDAVHQRRRAEVGEGNALQAAEGQRIAREDADRKTEEERKAREEADQHLYLHRVALAQREWEANHVQRALELLDACPEERRGWEWRYLRRLCQGSSLTISGHAARATAVAFSPDGKRIASAGEDKTVKVWDAHTGQELLTLQGRQGSVTAVVFSPNGARLAASSQDGTVKVWDSRTGRQVFSLRGHTHPVASVCFSPDGARLASAGWDQMVKLWDARTGKEQLAIRGPANRVHCVAFSPDGKRLVTGDDEWMVRLYDAETGRQTHLFRGHMEPINSVAWAPDGTRLATASGDVNQFVRQPGDVRVWDAQTGQEVLSLGGHTGGATSVVFSPDGMRLASAGGDRLVKVWNARTGKEVLSLKGHTDSVNAVAFSPDGMNLASAGMDRTVRVWDTRSAQEALSLEGHRNGAGAVCFSPDGSRLATSSMDRFVKLWDVRTAQEVLSIETPTLFGHILSFNPDGTRLAGPGTSSTGQVWDARTGQPLLTLRGHSKAVSAAVFSPDGTRLATASADRTVKVHDAQTGQVLRTLEWHPDGARWVVWSPDGTRLAGVGGVTVKVWDVQTGKESFSLEGEPGRVASVCFSPNGDRLAAACWDRTVKVWDATTGKAQLVLSGHTNHVYWAAFSPDGKRIASAGEDQTVRIWDARTGQETLTLRGHAHQVWTVAFSPDGTRLASASEDTTVKLWDARPLLSVELGSEPDPAWHRRRANEALALRDGYGARFHLGRLIELRPADPLGHRDLGRVMAEAGRWQEAIALFNRANELDPARADLGVLARAELGAGRIDDCKRMCRLLADRLQTRRVTAVVGQLWGQPLGSAVGPALLVRLAIRPLPEGPQERTLLVRLSVALPGVWEGPERLLAMVERADPLWRGPLLVRAGRYDEALQQLVGLNRQPPGPVYAQVRLFTALAEHGRGNLTAAGKAYSEASAWLDAPSREDAKQSNLALLDWGLRVEMEAIRRELEVLLRIPREPGHLDRVDGPFRQ